MRSSGHKDDLVQPMGASSASGPPYGVATKQGPAVETGTPATGYPQQGPSAYQVPQQGYGQPGYQGQPGAGFPGQPGYGQPNYQQGYPGQQATNANPNGIQPLPGLKIKGPRVPPVAGQILTGYEIEHPDVGCCKCEGLNTMGVVSVGLLVLFLPIIACLPCCMEDCFEKYQRPVYDFPMQQHHIPVGMPPQGYR